MPMTPENISLFEKQTFDETIAYLERLDDEYYETIPSFETLINQYGNLNGDRLYSARDLYMTYQRRYIEDHHISIYDINDERQCFVRRI